jgi:hypothetical protein
VLLFLTRPEREYTRKQYRAGPNGTKIIAQNQNTCFSAGESSKRNRKYSIPTPLRAVASTARNTRVLRNGRNGSSRIAIINGTNVNDTMAATR